VTPGQGPREGIYLGAALAVVEQQINERLDVLTRRRRTVTRALIAGLVVTTLGGGAATAAALTFAAAPSAPEVTVVETSLELHCVQGETADVPAFFTARLTVLGEAAADVDTAAICGAAFAAVGSDGGALRDSTPDELLANATALVADSAGLVDGETTVLESSFGAVSDSAGDGTRVTSCERADDGRVVVLVGTRDTSAAGAAPAALLCRANDGYRLYRGAR
jgi:hypothetical protein